MRKNQNQIDHEAMDLSDELETSMEIFSEEEYLISTMNCISEDILSDEFYERNRSLIRDMSNGFFIRNRRQGDMPPNVASRSFEIFFSSLAKFGLR